jgi:hypothetical protein
MYRYATELSPERADYLIDKLANWVISHKLETPAILLLESVRPLSFIGSQMWLMYGVPLLGMVVDERESSEYGLLFEDRENLEALIRKIETLAREADKRKKEREESKN